MKIKFDEFILESKNYNIYKGVNDLRQILLDGKIKLLKDYPWSSDMRKNLGIKDGVGISVTRNFSTAIGYGSTIIEFDTQKLSDRYKIIPIVENLDYYLNLHDKGVKGSLSKMLRLKEYGKEYWNIKTNKNAFDFGIAEEIIVASEVPIKYIKKVYIVGESRNSSNIELLELKSIPYEMIGLDHNTLMRLKLKNKS